MAGTARATPRAWLAAALLLLAVMGPAERARADDAEESPAETQPPLSAGAFNVTAKTLKAQLRAAGGSLYLGFSAPSCKFCRAYEAEYAAYHAFDAPPVPLGRVDASREKSLAARYDAETVPSLVLLHDGGKRSIVYKGAHEAAAMAAFAASRVGPAVRELPPGLAALDALVRAPRGPTDVLVVGFFTQPGGEEEEEVEDLAETAGALRAARPDAPVVAVRTTLGPAELAELTRARRWIERTPAVAVWVGGDDGDGGGGRGGGRGGGGGGGARAKKGGGGGAEEADGPPPAPRARALLDEALPGGASMAQWTMRSSLPRVAWLTELNFHTYAATELPMLILFVDPGAGEAAYASERGALEAVAREFDGRVLFVLCDGVKQRYRKIALGLTADTLPAMALNTKEEHARYPFEQDKPITAGAVRGFCADYLAGRLVPRLPDAKPLTPPPPERGPRAPVPLAGGGTYTPARPQGLGHVANLTAASVEAAVGDVRKDVLLLVYSSAQCGEVCAELDIYFGKAASRLAELGVHTVAPCRLDLAAHALPPSLPLPLHTLPIVIMLPAADKQPPFRYLEGDLKPRRLLYFAQAHATHAFELPENPHLDREQNRMWHEQVAELPEERRRRALATLLPEEF